MPIYKVQGPDGKTYTVEGPAGASASDLEAHITAQPSYKADAPAAPQAPARLNNIEEPNWFEKQLAKIPSSLVNNGAMTRARGFVVGGAEPGMGIVQAVANALPGDSGKNVNDLLNKKEAEYQSERGPNAGFDGARVLGNLATSALPMAKIAPAATLAMRTAQGFGLGAASGFAAPVLGGEDQGNFFGSKAKQVAIGGLLGGVLSPVTELAVKGVGNLVGRFGKNATPAAYKPEELARQADFNALGIQPTTGQITRNPQQFSNEVNLRGNNSKLADRFNQQNKGLLDQIDGLINGTGGKPTENAYETGRSLIGEISSQDATRRASVSQAYDKARQAAGGQIELNAAPLADQYGNTLKMYGQENIPSAVRSAMDSYGLGGLKQTKSYTPEEANSLLQIINANYDPMKAAQKGALDSLRTGVRSTMEGDALTPLAGEAANAYSSARKLASDRFKMMDSIPGYQDVVRGQAVPDNFFVKNVLGSTREEMKSMGGMLSQNPQVRNDIKAQAIDYLKTKAMGVSNDEVGTFSQSSFNKALSDNKQRFSELFDPNELDQLLKIGRVSSYMQKAPAGNYVNNSNTAVAQASKVLLGMSGLPFAEMLSSSVGKAANNRAANQALKGLLSAPVRSNQAAAYAGNIGLLASPFALAGVDGFR